MVIISNTVKIKSDFTGKIYKKTDYIWFFQKGKVSRLYGPAKFCPWYKDWIVNGKSYGTCVPSNTNSNYNQKQFIKDLNKKWLS